MMLFLRKMGFISKFNLHVVVPCSRCLFSTTPLSTVRTDSYLETLKSRVLYRSTKCGILENDILLGSYTRESLDVLSLQELYEFEALFLENDWDIYKWIVKDWCELDMPEHWKESSLLKKLRDFVQNRKNLPSKENDCSTLRS